MWGLRGGLRCLPDFCPGHPHACGDYWAGGWTALACAGHPHACGDYGIRAPYSRSAGGPSPRVWGLQVGPGLGYWRLGPSPRVWGLLVGIGGLLPPSRAIPTRVGTTGVPPLPPGIHPGHPHACGDYPNLPSLQKPADGPSPRVWGLRRFGRSGGRHTPGHPHACGDYAPLPGHGPDGHGPSPRVWGLRGGTSTSTHTATGHPHACGDYVVPTSGGGKGSGPSPRVWGLLLIVGHMAKAERAIPTRVGTTGPSSRRRCGCSGHPHACGDYAPGGLKAIVDLGPSPRVWGLRSPH